MWNIKKKESYLEGLLHETGLIYITNKLHHRKCFVRILFTRCKTLETHSFATLTRSFLKFCNSWIKIRSAHFLWSNLFISDRFYELWATLTSHNPWRLNNPNYSRWCALICGNETKLNDSKLVVTPSQVKNQPSIPQCNAKVRLSFVMIWQTIYCCDNDI